MCKLYFKKCLLITGLLLWLLPAFAQQLKLGVNPSGINKASVLELESTKQGLLLTRVSDTTAAPLNTAPDGMLIYFTVDKTLLIRKGGFWRRLIDITAVTANSWNYGGNAVSPAQNFGTTSNADLPVITNNVERMRLLAGGNLGIGTSAASTTLHIKSTTANQSGVRIENLTSASPVTAGAGGLGVDAQGVVVRTAAAPVLYNKSGLVNNTMVIWADTITNIATGLPVVSIPAGIFTKVLNVNATAIGGTNSTDMPVVAVASYTNTSVSLIVGKSTQTLLSLLGLTIGQIAVDNRTTTRIAVTIIGY